MANLSEEVQEYIVTALACGRKNSLIRAEVATEFALTVTRERVLFYHPEKGSKTKRLAKKWKDLFYETQKAFNEGKVQVAISNQLFRLGVYQRAAEFYEKERQYVLAAEMCEKAAKEIGGAYTNRRELTGKGGGPIETAGLTLEQWQAQAAERLAKAEEALATFDES
ncbi:MAG TPA: DUF2280 domain-containing protein [Pyrinomonadaceae bacterium]|jgi:hypothetical protein